MLFPEKFVNVYFNQQVPTEAWGGQEVGRAGFVGLAAYYHQIKQLSSRRCRYHQSPSCLRVQFGGASDVLIPSSCISNTLGPFHFGGKKERDCLQPKQTLSVFLCPGLGFLVIK